MISMTVTTAPVLTNQLLPPPPSPPQLINLRMFVLIIDRVVRSIYKFRPKLLFAPGALSNLPRTRMTVAVLIPIAVRPLVGRTHFVEVPLSILDMAQLLTCKFLTMTLLPPLAPKARLQLMFAIWKEKFLIPLLEEAPMTPREFPRVVPTNFIFVPPLMAQAPLPLLMDMEHIPLLSIKFAGVPALPIRHPLQWSLSTRQMLLLSLPTLLSSALLPLSPLLLPALEQILNIVLDSPPLGQLLLIPAKVTPFPTKQPISLTLIILLIPLTAMVTLLLESIHFPGSLTLWTT